MILIFKFVKFSHNCFNYSHNYRFFLLSVRLKPSTLLLQERHVDRDRDRERQRQTETETERHVVADIINYEYISYLKAFIY